MTEIAARQRLDEIVDKVNRDHGAATSFGVRSFMKGALENLGERPVRPVSPKVRVGHFNGNTGEVSELLVCVDLMSKGIEVYKAMNPHSPCDLIAVSGLDFIRIEVKTVRDSKTLPIIRPNRIDSFDVLAAVSRDGKIRYIPRASVRMEVALKVGCETGDIEISRLESAIP